MLRWYNLGQAEMGLAGHGSNMAMVFLGDFGDVDVGNSPFLNGPSVKICYFGVRVENDEATIFEPWDLTQSKKNPESTPPSRSLPVGGLAWVSTGNFHETSWDRMPSKLHDLSHCSKSNTLICSKIVWWFGLPTLHQQNQTARFGKKKCSLQLKKFWSPKLEHLSDFKFIENGVQKHVPYNIASNDTIFDD